jgi:hypothetical protein
MSITVVAVAYFSAVFSIGFVLGVARTLWLVPWVGERAAELVELPGMVVASYLVARALMHGLGRGLGVAAAAAAGCAALALLLAAEIGMVVVVRDESLSAYIRARDPIAGTAYLAALVVFAALPALVARRRAGRAEG